MIKALGPQKMKSASGTKRRAERGSRSKEVREGSRVQEQPGRVGTMPPPKDLTEAKQGESNLSVASGPEDLEQSFGDVPVANAKRTESG
jgi:hypothetical protein